MPRTVGDWHGEDISGFTADDMAHAGIQGWVHRGYRNPHTREQVSLLIVCGRGGPISVHTPDICYAGAGYEQLTNQKPREIDLGNGQKATFWMARFGKPGVVPSQLEIYWAWSRNGRDWEVTANPRVSLARSAALYKMYVVRELPIEVAGKPGFADDRSRSQTATKTEDASPCEAFLQRTLPDFVKALAPTD